MPDQRRSINVGSGKLLAGLRLDFDEELGTPAHELGHTLNLEHGGRQQRNYKPNYLSVMHYFFDSALPDTNAPMEF